MRRDDVFSIQTEGADIRLPEVRRTVSRTDPRECRTDGNRGRNRDRVCSHSEHQKEDRARELLAKRGDDPELVCILSAMEPCSTYKPWHNKQSGKTYLMPNDGKYLTTTFISLMKTRLLPRAGADMVALSFTDMHERAQLAGGPVSDHLKTYFSGHAGQRFRRAEILTIKKRIAAKLHLHRPRN